MTASVADTKSAARPSGINVGVSDQVLPESFETYTAVLKSAAATCTAIKAACGVTKSICSEPSSALSAPGGRGNAVTSAQFAPALSVRYKYTEPDEYVTPVTQPVCMFRGVSPFLSPPSGRESCAWESFGSLI